MQFSPVRVGEWRPERHMELDEALREWFTCVATSSLCVCGFLVDVTVVACI